MPHAEIAAAVSAFGVDLVEVLGIALGSARWSAGVVPFARVHASSPEIAIVRPAALGAAGHDESRALASAIARRPGVEPRLTAHAQRIAVLLDREAVAWDWAAVRVRRTAEGGSRAAIELGRGPVPLDTLDLLESPTIVPPPGAAASATVPRPPKMPSFFPPAASPSQPPGRIAHSPPADVLPGVSAVSSLAGVITSAAMGQPELAKTMLRAQGLLGSKQESLARAIVAHVAVELHPKERAIEFTFSHGRVRRYGADQMAGYEPGSGKWTWGWDNPSFAPIARSQSRKLRETGQNWRLSAFTEKELRVPPESAFKLGVAAAWILGADACHFVREGGGVEVVVAVYGVA